jgi:hypothetical protein
LLSQGAATPRGADQGEYRDTVAFLQHSQDSQRQKTLTNNTQYSMKTMLVGHGGLKNEHGAAAVNTYYSHNDNRSYDLPHANSNNSQQEWTYSND